MKVKTHRLELPLQHEFTIARGSMTSQRTLIVELEHEGVFGYGESTENSYYGYTLDSMSHSISQCKQLLDDYQFGTPSELWKVLKAKLSDDVFALSSLDLAAHDLFGKLAKQYTFETLDLKWQDVVDSSYTIGIDNIEKMIAKLRERPNWKTYKIKLGTQRDVEIIRQLRNQTDAIFRVDANCGWTVDETIENSKALKELGVEFIEQPLPADAPDDSQKRIFDESALSIIADESCLIESDVENCEGRFHGINVKLCKCGGLTPAAGMLRHAKSLGMKTMVGCMVESSVGISAAAQLLPLLDYADLDGAVLLADEPTAGVTIADGRVQLAEQFGNGASLLPSRLGEFTVTKR